MTTQKIVILFFDIDLFKRINDTLGHKIGDDVLIHLAEILNKSLRPTDLAARLGGDEFVVMLTDMDEEAIKPTVDRLHKKIAKPTIIHGHQLSINTSMGVTIYPDDGSSIEELLKKADIALYEVKDNGRGHYLFYSTALSKALEDAHRKEKDLQRGYDEKEFCLYYQPIYDCQTKRIICLESLIRWQHPEKGLLHAGKIIPLAEKTGLINIIGEWSIRTACSQVKKWQNSGIPIVPVAVNLSYLQAQQSSLNELIFEILAETGLDPHLLVLELTETGYIQITPQIIAELHLLRDRGIQLSVDDFGTGYSGLRYLKSLPINKLKIDQSFIKDILVNPDDYAITLAIIAIANQLRLEIIAEGIESKEQFELLKMHRVNGAQGFYLCPPISAAECEKLLIQNAQEFERV